MSLATGRVTDLAMRRYTKVWAVGLQPRNGSYLGAQGFICPEGSNARSRHGQRRGNRRGVRLRYATRGWFGKQGGPHPSSGNAVARRAGPKISKARTHAGERSMAAKNMILHRGTPPQGEPERRPMGLRESEGCIRAMTAGNGAAPGPGRAKVARVDVNFRRDPCPTHRRRAACHRNC